MSYIESQEKIECCNNTRDVDLTFTWTVLKSNALFVLTSRAVAVLYVALCPGESHCSPRAKDNVLPDSRIYSNCSS